VVPAEELAMKKVGELDEGEFGSAFEHLKGVAGTRQSSFSSKASSEDMPEDFVELGGFTPWPRSLNMACSKCEIIKW